MNTQTPAFRRGYDAANEAIALHMEIHRKEAFSRGREFRFPIISILDELRESYSIYKFDPDEDGENSSESILNTLDCFTAGVNAALFDSADYW